MATSNLTELISWQEQPLAYIIRAEFMSEKTTFFTPPEWEQQVGIIVYSAGEKIPRHAHRSMPHQHSKASEILLVRRGRCIVDVYNHKQHLVATRELRPGDAIFLIDGGHGFRLLEDTVFLEIKTGPYLGPGEKNHF
jgi:mannose-6-phosphate isomerase-like protein (cupin superfamily)